MPKIDPNTQNLVFQQLEIDHYIGMFGIVCDNLELIMNMLCDFIKLGTILILTVLPLAILAISMLSESAKNEFMLWYV